MRGVDGSRSEMSLALMWRSLVKKKGCNSRYLRCRKEGIARCALALALTLEETLCSPLPSLSSKSSVSQTAANCGALRSLRHIAYLDNKHVRKMPQYDNTACDRSHSPKKKKIRKKEKEGATCFPRWKEQLVPTEGTTCTTSKVEGAPIYADCGRGDPQSYR